jgi:hypothetical protein
MQAFRPVRFLISSDECRVTIDELDVGYCPLDVGFLKKKLVQVFKLVPKVNAGLQTSKIPHLK